MPICISFIFWCLSRAQIENMLALPIILTDDLQNTMTDEDTYKQIQAVEAYDLRCL